MRDMWIYQCNMNCELMNKIYLHVLLSRNLTAIPYSLIRITSNVPSAHHHSILRPSGAAIDLICGETSGAASGLTIDLICGETSRASSHQRWIQSGVCGVLEGSSWVWDWNQGSASPQIKNGEWLLPSGNLNRLHSSGCVWHSNWICTSLEGSS